MEALFKLRRYSLVLVAVFSFLNIGRYEAARILAFFPHPLMSHQLFYRPIVRALGNYGHNVTYVSGFDWKDNHPNVEHRMLDLSFIGELRNKLFDFTLEEIHARTAPLSLMNAPLNEVSMLISQKVVQDAVVQELIHSDERYDLVMTEAFDGYEHFTAFAHKFNATSVVLLARGDNAWANEMSGFADNPTYMVNSKSPYNTVMTRMERLFNTVILHATRFHGYRFLVQSQAFVDKFFNYPGWETRPPISQLAADQALVLVNSHHSVGYSYPRAPHVKEIGGVSIQQPKSLPRKIRSFVEEAEHGVIYFSLGNYIDFSSPFKESTRSIFVEVFSKRKERVLWKWNGEGLDEKPENIMFLRWLPQPDILAHNNTKVFISHGGLLSLMEAVSFAVPVVGIVMAEEARKNMNVAKESGYALDIDFRDVTVDSLNEVIDEIVHDSKYKNKALEVSSLFKDRPLKPLDEAVYWIEYVLRHGKVLQPASLHMPYYELYMWDLSAIFGLMFLTVALVIAIIIGIIITGLVLILEQRNPTATLLLKDKDKCS